MRFAKRKTERLVIFAGYENNVHLIPLRYFPAPSSCSKEPTDHHLYFLNVMSAKLIKSILDEAPELRTLTKRSRQLLHLQQYLKEALPTNIASRSAISSLSDGALTIATDNGAAAAKIRQMAPRLLSR